MNIWNMWFTCNSIFLSTNGCTNKDDEELLKICMLIWKQGCVCLGQSARFFGRMSQCPMNRLSDICFTWKPCENLFDESRLNLLSWNLDLEWPSWIVKVSFFFWSHVTSELRPAIGMWQIVAASSAAQTARAAASIAGAHGSTGLDGFYRILMILLVWFTFKRWFLFCLSRSGFVTFLRCFLEVNYTDRVWVWY